MVIVVEPLRRTRSKRDKSSGSEAQIRAATATVERLISDDTALKEPIIDVMFFDNPQQNPAQVLVTLIEPLRPSQPSPPMTFLRLVAIRLIPGKQLRAVASTSTELQLKQGREIFPMRVSQVVLEVPRQDIDAAKRSQYYFKQEVALTLRSPPFAQMLCDSRSCLIDSHRLALYRLLARFATRIVQRGFALFTHAQWVITTWPGGIAECRRAHHLARIVIGSFVMRTRISAKPTGPLSLRSLEVDLFPICIENPAGKRSGLAICTLLTFHKQSELFTPEQILAAVETLHPNIRPVLGSQFADNLSGANERMVYLEIEKTSGCAFTRTEIVHLRQLLSAELKERIEKLIHPVFIPRSDKELLHHIAWLSRELREVTDLPQVMISFDKQLSHALHFAILLVRVRRPGDSEVAALLKRQPLAMDMRTRFIKTIGHLRDTHPQEAVVFDVRQPKQGFLRKDGSIDLLSARSKALSALTDLFGEVRDINGGMIVKQNEAFVQLTKTIGETSADRKFLLENFFYSITPTPMQGIAATEPLAALFHLVEECIAKGKESLHRLAYSHCLFVVTTTHGGLKEHLDQSLEQLGLGDLDAASSEVSIDSRQAIAYLYASHDTSRLRLFLRTLTSALEQFKNRRASRQVLRLNIPKGILSLDPRIGGDQQSGIVKRMLYDGLMRLDKRGAPILALASSFEISPDRLTYTFTLKKGLEWSTGDPIIAYDFEYAWKKVLDPSFQTPFVTIFYIIKHAEAASEGRLALDDVGVRALDEQCLEVRLEQPAPYFLELVAHWAFSPVSSKSDRIHPGWAHTGAETYAASGPFKLALFDYGKRIEFVKNPRYWDVEHVRLEKIEISMIQDSNAELKMYENEEIDWVGQPFSIMPLSVSYEMRRQGKLLSSPVAATTWLEFNVESFPFNNAKMRRALSIGFDRTKLTETIVPGRSAPATSVIPQGLSIHQEPYFTDGNTQLAKQLFAEALEEMGCTKESLPQVSILCPDSEIWRAVIAEIKRQLTDLFSIDICVRVYEWEEFFTHRSNNFFQIAGISWYCWHSDPIYVLNVFKHRTNSLNSTQWESAQYIDYLNHASCECAEDRRLELLRQAERHLINEMPVMPLFYDGDCYMCKDYLKSINISKTGDIDFKEAYIRHE